ncbi:HK97 gp10 family phage protein [Oceanobacillus massiliensis]|uniref:HK97 gp10 family phage protein n=1 Tax=Oceanobacillus massiliensis TaxID=1465765 RepID=UPI003015A3F5
MAKFNNRFKEAKQDIRKKRETTAEMVGLFAEAESKLRTPVKTGRLRREITHEVAHEENKSTTVVGSNVEYDGIVELGLGGQQAQPHHTPAVTENLGSIQKMINDGMKVK